MKHSVVLSIVSLLSILFTTFHHADDVARGMAPGGLSNLVPVFFLVVWLHGTLVLAGRRSGYVIVLVMSLLASGLPLVHMTGAGLAGDQNADSGEGFFFGWTLLALEVTALFSVSLSARGLWSLRGVQPTPGVRSPLVRSDPADRDPNEAPNLTLCAAPHAP